MPLISGLIVGCVHAATITFNSPRPLLAAVAVAVALLVALTGVPSAQAPLHLNRMIERLAQGEVAFGVSK